MGFFGCRNLVSLPLSITSSILFLLSLHRRTLRWAQGWGPSPSEVEPPLDVDHQGGEEAGDDFW